ncbi:glycogen synthase GlgA [Tropicimonas sp. IMCC6043]|uniref:glycogen synthase GlgA n=1 Tax=Tropicimonas sp. IMCC6043 TaxID=2510645 RepID=UPI00101D00E2|nr:glycogen synthase GlgA [Tropicimonas sp. IMCC6043]RYH11159.1 glycogen synthase GlgA [Tropicimonas sp. IMCC6043]
MKVLSVASEIAPLVKTGGLADVVGALPAAIRAQGVDMRTLVPGYPVILKALKGGVQVMTEGNLFGGPVQVLLGEAVGHKLYVLDASHLFWRDGGPYAAPDGYEWWDNAERFAALSWIAARLAHESDQKGWKPDVVQAHDWQGGFAPVYMQRLGASHDTGSVMTIHNIAYTGSVGADAMRDLRLPWEGYNAGGFEFYGRISALKAGIAYADKVNTVSPTYARELTTPEFGMGFDGTLAHKGGDFSGILNGIDVDVWNPATDPHIETYKVLRGKLKARAALVAEMGLAEASGPLCVVVSRLTEQKGLDLLLAALPGLLARGGQLALLGSGDPWLEGQFREAAARHPGHVAVRIGYDEALSHRLIAGGDAILVPSRFEPCGLTQLYGLRYGTVPVVAMTGGLADTVIPLTVATRIAGVATGLLHAPGNAAALSEALGTLCDVWANPGLYQQMQRNAMKHPVGWDVSAAEYAALFKEAAKTP